ncbi:hypothetical protein SAMN06265827_10316 [Orenia metallireducens]|uniref:Uncharacterized protein n=1 Tax=Orenia metallireducens TaxID=1413210 RepID=A0A285FVL3_9FIRM|nr:hypothetical protein [Orenia metallireducens]SNY15319.1 hypothetical protein SAMN06265827_10316 [Orenia metallireducens]
MKKINDLFLTLLLFLYIYNVPFKFISFGTSKLFVFSSLIFILIIFLKNKKLLFLSKRCVFFLVLFILTLIIYSFLITGLVKQTYDFFPIYIYILFLIEHLLGGTIILLFMSINNSLNMKKFMNLFINMTFLQSVITVLMFLNSGLREFVFSIADTKGDILFEMYNGIRGFGLASNLTYDFAVIQSIGLIFSIYFILIKRSGKYTLLFKMMMIFISIILSARTGWIGIFFAILLFVFISTRNKYNFQKGFKITLVSLFIFVFLVFIIFNFILPHNLKIKIKDEIVPFAFELFLAIFEKGSLETGSTNVLFGRMYFKMSLETILIGDGFYLDPNGDGFYMHTDAGYMTQILYYGIFGSLLLYYIYIYIFYVIDKKLKIKNYSIVRVIYIFIALYYFLVQVKGDFLLNGMGAKFIFLSLLVLINENNKIKLYYNRFNI